MATLPTLSRGPTSEPSGTRIRPGRFSWRFPLTSATIWPNSAKKADCLTASNARHHGKRLTGLPPRHGIVQARHTRNPRTRRNPADSRSAFRDAIRPLRDFSSIGRLSGRRQGGACVVLRVAASRAGLRCRRSCGGKRARCRVGAQARNKQRCERWRFVPISLCVRGALRCASSCGRVEKRGVRPANASAIMY